MGYFFCNSTMREYDYSLVGIWKSGKEVVSVSLVKEGIFVGRQLLFVFFQSQEWK